MVMPDAGFADIRTYPPPDFAGLVVLRLSRQSRLAVLRAIESVLALLGDEPLDGRLWIVDEQAIRIRAGAGDVPG